MPLLDIGIKEKIVRPLLHISGGRGLVYDKAGGALTNGSSGAKNVIDFEWIVRSTVSNEIRYSSARRIANTLRYSEDFDNVAWVVAKAGVGILPVKTANYGLAPDGTMTAARVQLNLNGGTSLGDQSYIYQVHFLPSYAPSFYMKLNSGTSGTINLVGPKTQMVTVTNQWQRFDSNGIGTLTQNTVLSLRGTVGSSDTMDLLIWHPKSAYTLGSYNTSSDEYINSEVVHNAGVIGVKYSNTYNKNSTNESTGAVNPFLPYKYALGVGDSFGDGASEWIELLNGYIGMGVDNFAVSGASITGIVGTNISTQLSAHLADKDYWAVFLQGGVNDLNNSATIADMQTAMQNNIASIPAGVDIFVINVAPWSNYATSNATKQAATMAWNNWLNTYLPTVGANLVDIYTALGDPANPTAMLPAYTSDNLHPNAAGEIIIKDAIIAKMVTLDDRLLPGTTSILHEKATSNLSLFPRDLTNAAYVKTDCTAAKTAIGTDGVLNSASTLTATAANATCLQTVVSASAERITGAFIKRRTGTGAVYMTQDNGSTWTEITITSSWTAAPYTIPAATLANPVLGFKLAVSGDAIDVDWVQHELGGYVTSPISGSRTIDSIKIPASAGVNFNQDNQITLVKIKMNFANSAGNKTLFAANTGATDFIYDNGGGGIALSDGVNTATAAVGGWAAGDTLLIAECHTTADDLMSIHVSKNGGAWVDSADTTYDGAFSIGANLLLASANTDSIEFYHVSTNVTNMSHSEMVTFAKTNAEARAT